MAMVVSSVHVHVSGYMYVELDKFSLSIILTTLFKSFDVQQPWPLSGLSAFCKMPLPCAVTPYNGLCLKGVPLSSLALILYLNLRFKLIIL